MYSELKHSGIKKIGITPTFRLERKVKQCLRNCLLYEIVTPLDVIKGIHNIGDTQNDIVN